MKIDNEFIRTHAHIVRCIVRQFGKTNFTQDLMQEGYIGLIEAGKRYDPGTRVTFDSYASWWVRKYMRLWMLKHSQIVRLSVKTKDFYKPITENIEKPLYEEDGDLIRYADILTDGSTAETDFIRQEEHQRLRTAIEKLPAREQQLIRQIYGIGQEKVPQAQIAHQLGITQMTLWRIHQLALKKLKKMLI